jgi:hypothetical protein
MPHVLLHAKHWWTAALRTKNHAGRLTAAVGAQLLCAGKRNWWSGAVSHPRAPAVLFWCFAGSIAPSAAGELPYFSDCMLKKAAHGVHTLYAMADNAIIYVPVLLHN